MNNSGYRSNPGECNQCPYCGAGLGAVPHVEHYPHCEAHSEAHRMGAPYALYAVSCRRGECNIYGEVQGEL